MAIDREINQRVEAYGNNPGALQKRYAASKELIDLLALQRLKTQKDDAARQIQMEMAQMPGTIKAQREQELMGQSVQDLSKRTADTMRNMAQKKQMKSMQKGVAERTKGLASLAGNPQMAMAQQNRPQQPQPQRMQAGGIVALAEGGDVEVKREIQRLINMGYSDEEIKGMLSKTPEEVIKSVRRQQQEDMRASGRGVPAEKRRDIPAGREFDEPKKEEPRRGGRLAESGRVEEKAREAAPRPDSLFGQAKPDDVEELKRRGLLPPNFKGSISSRRAEEMLAGPVQAPEPKPEGIAAVAEPPTESVGVRRSDANKPSTDSIVDKLITPKEVPVAQQAGMEERIPESDIQRVKEGKVQPVPQLKPETISTEGTFDLSRDMLKEVGLDPAAIDPDKAGINARDDTMKYLSEVVGPDGVKTTKDAEMRERLAGLEALDKRQQDPDMLRRERLMAGLGGAARGGLGGYARGSSKMGAAQARGERERQLKTMEILGQIQDRDNTLRLNATAAQQKTFAEHSANRRQVISALSTASDAEIRRRTAEARLKFEANQGNVTNSLKRLEVDAINNMRRLQATEGSIADTQTLLARTLEDLQKARLAYVTEDENVRQAKSFENAVINDPESSQEKRDAAVARKQAATAAATIGFEALASEEHSRLMNLIKQLEADLVSMKSRRRGLADPQYANTPVTLSSSEASDAYTRNNIGG